MAIVSMCPRHKKVPAGQMIFTTSQVCIIPKGVKKIDIFCSGGGGAGGGGIGTNFEVGVHDGNFYGGDGGGGGYTATKLNQTVTPLEEVNVIVGEGGIAAIPTGGLASIAGDGGASSFGSYLTAQGGIGGSICTKYTTQVTRARASSSGGSGGGAGGYRYWNKDGFSYGYDHVSGKGGSDGSNGYHYDYNPEYAYSDYPRNAGQGTTTRAFGEPTGTVYGAGGGGALGSMNDYVTTLALRPFGGQVGGGQGKHRTYTNSTFTPYPATAGAANTGAGGGGANAVWDDNVRSYLPTAGANGGSGIVIIRWDEQ